jgi:type I restriction enzyme M protein
MFEQAFQAHWRHPPKGRGVSSELDYIEQTSWILLLKYLNAFEDDRSAQAEVDGRKFTPLLEPRFRWAERAVPAP